MPRKTYYRSLLFLIGICSNLLNHFNKKEIVFHFFLIRFHFLFCDKTDGYTKKCRRCLRFCWFLFGILYWLIGSKNQGERTDDVARRRASKVYNLILEVVHIVLRILDARLIILNFKVNLCVGRTILIPTKKMTTARVIITVRVIRSPFHRYMVGLCFLLTSLGLSFHLILKFLFLTYLLFLSVNMNIKKAPIILFPPFYDRKIRTTKASLFCRLGPTFALLITRPIF